MTREPLSPIRLAAIRAGIKRNPGTPSAQTIRVLLDEIDRLTLAPTRPCRLTSPEMDVLIGAANGETTAMTGRRLKRSEMTVKSHRRRIYKRLGVVDAPQAVAVAMAEGWITPEQIRIPQGQNPPDRRLPKPAKQARQASHRRRAAELRQKPGELGLVGTYKTPQAAKQTAYRIREGLFTAYRPAGAYDAKHITRDGEHRVYAGFADTGIPFHSTPLPERSA